MKFKTLSLGLLVLATGLLSLSGQAADPAPPAGAVQIGMTQTLFTDIPQWQINIAQVPFAGLMKEQTGVDGKLNIAGDGLTVGKLLHENKYQLGIFQGIEFAWAQHKYHDLKPLMIAVSYHPILHANLVVREDSPATGFAGLVGKDLALPKRSKMHIQLFLNKGCNGCGQAEPCKHFHQLTRPESLVDALDHVLLGETQATVVDDLGLEHYKDLKPGCFKRLKVLVKSEDFPTGVIAYRENGLDKETLAKFRQGMVNAKNDTKARELMALFQLTGFEDVPANFANTLATIIRAYPPPDADKSSKTSTGP